MEIQESKNISTFKCSHFSYQYKFLQFLSITGNMIKIILLRTSHKYITFMHLLLERFGILFSPQPSLFSNDIYPIFVIIEP